MNTRPVSFTKRRCLLLLCVLLSSTTELSADPVIEFFDGNDNKVGVLLDYGTRGDLTILTTNGYVINYNPHIYSGSIYSNKLSFESEDCSGPPIVFKTSYGGFEELYTGGKIYGVQGTEKIIKIDWSPTLTEVFPKSYLAVCRV